MGGMLGKKGKETGEDVLVQADVAFVPGDTVRYFACNISMFEGSSLTGEAILDAYELAALHTAVTYMLQTAGHMIDTERADTRIQHRTKCGFEVLFAQQGKGQAFELAWPAADGKSIRRGLEADQFQSLADLLALTMFELRRQGAVIQAAAELPR
jgi:hypothetical protein